MDHKAHIQNLVAEDTCSAQKAVDYLDGYYRRYLESMLDGSDSQSSGYYGWSAGKNAGINNWRERGVQLLWENHVGLIVEKSAKTYQYQPERSVLVNGVENESASDTYRQILKESNFRPAVEDLDQLARLLKTSVIIPQYIEETGEFLFSVVSRNNADVDYDPKTGEIKSLMYTANACGPKGGRLYHYWTGYKVIDLEMIKWEKSKGGSPEMFVVGEEANPYGIVPAAFLYDVRKPRYNVWQKPAWEQLTYLSDSVNMFHIETKFNSRYGAIGALFTNVKIPEGAVIGPDAVIEFEEQPGGVTPFVEYRAPQVDVEPFRAWLDGYIESVGAQWGVNLKVAGSGSADSGFKLVVEEAPSLELREKRVNAAKDFERNLYKVIARMGEVHGFGLPVDGELVADFDEPSLPVDKKQSWDIWKEQIALGVKTLEDYWRWENPDITDEQIAEKKAEQNMSARLPNFDQQAGV